MTIRKCEQRRADTAQHEQPSGETELGCRVDIVANRGHDIATDRPAADQGAEAHRDTSYGTSECVESVYFQTDPFNLSITTERNRMKSKENDTEPKEVIKIPEKTLSMVEQRIQGTQFTSVDEYINYVILECLHQMDTRESSGTEIETGGEVKERLEKLGYLE